MAQMKEQIKALEKNTIKQQRDSQPIRCAVLNAGNQDAHRNGWAQSFNHCEMKEQMKATQSEIKQNIWGTNSYRKETGTQINGLEQKEERNIQPGQWKNKNSKKWGEA